MECRFAIANCQLASSATSDTTRASALGNRQSSLVFDARNAGLYSLIAPKDQPPSQNLLEDHCDNNHAKRS